ncbi:MFS transporter [Streptococcus gallolyticus]|uniref:ABC transporter permease n=1 Tax=Streptococcus hepaticus TaxID=3349163 RepID=UPI001C96DF44|nr:MFS transporter [Streptococcus gallolyticus]MBY5040732.1 MFS transporter [Streptococcus gallolyticus]
MEKKWTHLIVFAVLSGISSVYRLWSTFTAHFDEAAVRKVYEQAGIPNADDMINMARSSVELQTSLVMKVFVVLLLLAMVAVVVFLVQKKGELASYTYIGYLFGTLVLATYSFVAGRGVLQQISEESIRQISQATLMGTFAVQVVLFAVYFGLTIFFHLRKPKVLPDMGQNATDI